MSFLNQLSVGLKNKRNKDKLIAEADDGTNAVDDETKEPTEDGSVEDDTTTTEDTGDTVSEPTSESFTDEEMNDFNDMGVTEDDLNSSDKYFSDNMTDAGMTQDSPEYERANMKLNRAFSDMYYTYKNLIQELKNLDLSADKSTVINEFIRRYSEALSTMIDYTSSNSTDPYEIKYQQFIKFKALFISYNEQLAKINKDTNIL